MDNLIKSTINVTFEILRELYNNGCSDNTKLVIPEYRNDHVVGGEISKKVSRFSEQELRFIFVEQISKVLPKGYSYSIETPTKDNYSFTQNGQKLKPLQRGTGKSGNIDLTIQNQGHIEAIIEFKANSHESHSYAKDLCKLWNPKEGYDALRYFIIGFENMTQKTYDNVIKSINNNNYYSKQIGDVDIYIVCKTITRGQDNFELNIKDINLKV